MSRLKKVLMSRDGLTSEQADLEISQAAADLQDRIADGEMPFDYMEEVYGLEPDYLEDLIY